jgi:hypothetical protein
VNAARRLEIEWFIERAHSSRPRVKGGQHGETWPEVAQELLAEVDRLKSGQMRTDIDPWDG